MWKTLRYQRGDNTCRKNVQKRNIPHEDVFTVKYLTHLFKDSGFQSQHFGFFLWFKPKNTVFSNLLVVFGSWVTTSEMMRSCRGTYYGSLCVHFHTQAFFNSSFEHWHTLWRCCSWGLFNLDGLVRKHSKDNPYQNADVNMARAFTEEELEIKCALFTWTQCDHSWVEQCCETERERLFYISTVNVLLSVKTCVVKGSETVPWVSEVKSSSHVKAPQIRWLGRLFFLLFWSRVSNEGRGIAGSSVFFS